MIDEKELVNFIKEQQAEDDKVYKMLSWDNYFTAVYEAKTRTRTQILNFIEDFIDDKAIPNVSIDIKAIPPVSIQTKNKLKKLIERNTEYIIMSENIKKSNISYNRIEQVILSMNVTNGVGTAISCNLTGKQIDELETLIERLIKETNAITKE